jgi:diguanylate cyclase (GGDEF)-like protein
MDYRYERFILNKFCEFSDREIESEYMEFEKNASVNIIRFLLVFMGLAFASFVISDYHFHKETGFFPIAVGLRISAFLITAAASFFVKKFRRYDHALVMVTLAQLAIFLIYLVNLYFIEAHQISLQFMTIMLFIFMVFIIPNKWNYSFAANFLILVGYILFSVFYKNSEGLPTLAQRGIYFGITFILCGLSSFSRERSRRKQFAAEKMLEQMSITDRLTGIFNRVRFESVLGHWIKNMRHEPFCLLLLDIDDFKKVNDRFGHTEGDRVLVETTQTISANIRDDDIFARWGGEEFVILLGGITLKKAAERAECLRKAVEANPSGKAQRVTISIGGVQYRKNETIAEVVNRADAKMYEAKKAGKNCVMVDTV